MNFRKFIRPFQRVKNYFFCPYALHIIVIIAQTIPYINVMFIKSISVNRANIFLIITFFIKDKSWIEKMPSFIII